MSQFYQCQTCPATVSYITEDDRVLKTKDWLVHAHTTPLGPLNIITCPECSWLPSDQVLAGYKRRIAQGHDLRYH